MFTVFLVVYLLTCVSLVCAAGVSTWCINLPIYTVRLLSVSLASIGTDSVCLCILLTVYVSALAVYLIYLFYVFASCVYLVSLPHESASHVTTVCARLRSLPMVVSMYLVWPVFFFLFL